MYITFREITENIVLRKQLVSERITEVNNSKISDDLKLKNLEQLNTELVKLDDMLEVANA